MLGGQRALQVEIDALKGEVGSLKSILALEQDMAAKQAAIAADVRARDRHRHAAHSPLRRRRLSCCGTARARPSMRRWKRLRCTRRCRTCRARMRGWHWTWRTWRPCSPPSSRVCPPHHTPPHPTPPACRGGACGGCSGGKGDGAGGAAGAGGRVGGAREEAAGPRGAGGGARRERLTVPMPPCMPLTGAAAEEKVFEANQAAENAEADAVQARARRQSALTLTGGRPILTPSSLRRSTKWRWRRCCSCAAWSSSSGARPRPPPAHRSPRPHPRSPSSHHLSILRSPQPHRRCQRHPLPRPRSRSLRMHGPPSLRLHQHTPRCLMRHPCRPSPEPRARLQPTCRPNTCPARRTTPAMLVLRRFPRPRPCPCRACTLPRRMLHRSTSRSPSRTCRSHHRTRPPSRVPSSPLHHLLPRPCRCQPRAAWRRPRRCFCVRPRHQHCQ